MKFYVDIEIRAEGPTTHFNVSEQNYRFEYDTNVLGVPTIDQELVISDNVTTDIPLSLSLYQPHTLIGTQPGLVSYNVELSAGDGYPLNDIEYTKVGRLVFDILDLSQTINLIWHSTTDFPVTFVGEKFDGSLYVAAEGYLGNYIQDLSVLQQTNQPPLAANDFVSLPSTDTSYINILNNDMDMESDLDHSSVYLLTFPPASEGMAYVDTLTGQVVFIPVQGFSGDVSSFQYVVCDFGLGIPAVVGDQNPDPPSDPDPMDDFLSLTDPLCNSASISINVPPPAAPEFQLRVFLEGPYVVGGSMTNLLQQNALIPQEQPYGPAPWNHPGAEILSNFPASVVDWVLVTARFDTDHASTIATAAGLLNSDGWITGIDGGNIQFETNIGTYDSLYIAIYHRNHVGLMSAEKLSLAPGAIIYDFTDDASKSFAGITGTMQVEPGVFAMLGGDFNANGQVQNTDYNLMIPNIGLPGYRPGDFDLNGQVQNVDVQELLFPNLGRGANFSY